MRSVLFVYDAKVISDEDGNLYTNGTITERIWRERYCKYGKVTFISFLVNESIPSSQAKKKYSKIPSEVCFVPISQTTDSIKHFLSLSLRKKNNAIIEKHVFNNDVIIVRIPSNNSYAAIKYALKLKKTVISEVVGCSFESLWNHSFKGKLLSFISLFKQKKYVKKSSNVIYVTNKFLQNRYPTNGFSIGCSDVELPTINKNIFNDRIKRINEIKENNRIILGTCGAIDVKYKGHIHVIKALSELKRIGIDNFEYQIVGSGSSERILEYAKKYEVIDEINIIGALTHDKVFEWLKDIDIYIQPSDTEGLCRSLIEAMSMCLPCIASKVGGNTELIDSSFLFRKKDYKGLSNILKNYSVDKMLEQANVNYNKSKSFLKSDLDQKREYFYDYVMNRKGVYNEK